MKTLRSPALGGLVLAFVILNSSFVIPSAVRAGDVVNNLSQATNGTGEALNPAGDTGAHAFTIGARPVRLDSVTVQLQHFVTGGFSSTARVRVWSGAGATPVALVEDLGTVTFNVTAATSYTLGSASHPTLAAGTRYWVSVSNVSGDFDWNLTTSTTSTGTGTLLAERAVSTDDGANWGTFSGIRHKFAINGPQILTVMNTNDAGAGSLRQAVADALAGDLIIFNAGLSGGTITLGSEIVLDKNAVIDAGSLSAGITLNGNAATRILRVTSGTTCTLTALTLANGKADTGSLNGQGSGIHNSGSLTLNRCTLTGNSAPNVNGGGIFNASGASLTVNQSTFEGNTAAQGGGIRNEGTLTVNQSTIAGNSAPTGTGGGIFNGISRTLTLTNSIVAGNSASSSSSADIRNDGTVTRVGANLVQALQNSGGGADTGPAAINAAPLLGGLGNYGGPTRTMPPLSGSPAVNAALGFPGATDQRRLARGDFSWEHDFTSANLNGATVLTSASPHPFTGKVDAGSFRFMSKAQAQTASLVLPDPGAFASFAASFDLFYSDSAGSGFGGPADGMCFSFGPAPGAAVGENGVAGAHRIGFNIYNNADANNGLLRYINPAGTVVQEVTFPRFGDINAWQKFTVTVDATGRLRVSYKGLAALDVANIGALTGQRFTFSARTGGDVSEQRVDNIAIVTDIAGGAPDIGAVERGLLIPGFSPVVTSTADTYDGLDVNGVSLREVADLAAPGSTITFDAGLSGQSITLGGTHIVLDKNLTVDASALSGGISISGNSDGDNTLEAGESRIFDIPAGKTVLLRRLRLINGMAGLSDGGAILSAGQLTVEHCSVSACRARFGGGFGVGGGSATLTHTTLSGNSTGEDGGAIYNNGGTLTLTHCTLSSNFGGASGGGIRNANGTVALAHSIVAGNTAPSGGADISNVATVTRTGANLVQALENIGPGSDSGPAAINAPPLLAPLGNYGGPTRTMPPLPGSPAIDPAGGATTSTFTTDQRGAPRVVDGDGNGSAIVDIGAVEFVPAIVTHTADSGAGSLRAAVASADPFVSVVIFVPGLSGQTITLTTGHLTLNRSLTVDASTLAGGISISGNSDGDNTLEPGESRIFDIPAGVTALLRRLSLINGIADPTADDNRNLGGAIRSAGQLTVEQCAVSGCRARFGGSIHHAGGSAALTQSTLSGNSASNAGGGIVASSGSVTLTQSTLSGNSAATGGGIRIFGGSVTFTRSIVAGNSAPSFPDIEGSFTNGGNNLTSGNPLLAPLCDYGGPTRTMLPLPGSPAIDAGGSTASPITTDQRGVARVAGAAVDIGAVETFTLAGFLDTDGDGMDDRLEPLYGFIVGVPDGAGDADGDGSSNAAELGNLTSPRDPTSLLRILSFTFVGLALDGDPVFDVTWTTFPGLNYTIQAKADLNFTLAPREAAPVTATAFTHTLRIELDKNNPKDFIRVRRN